MRQHLKRSLEQQDLDAKSKVNFCNDFFKRLATTRERKKQRSLEVSRRRQQ